MYQIDHTDPPGIRRAIVRDVLLGALDPALALPAGEAAPCQVLLLRPCESGHTLNTDILVKMLHLSGQPEFCIDLVPMGLEQALVLWGTAAIRKLEEFLAAWQQPDSAVSRALRFHDPFFLACGRAAAAPEELPLSYQDAQGLMQQRFFCGPKQLLLRPQDMQDRSARMPTINLLLLENYTARLLQSIQAFNRTMTASVLAELEAALSSGSDSPEAIRLFFADLYLRIKEQMKYLYQGYTIPFYTNTHIIKTLLEAPRISDITCFLAQRFDMIMSSIGASSQESVLDSILHYIHHNYTSNITLESIAPLFGYNHSYLGKIFRKKMGVSFNEYIDRLRVEQAKALLLQDNSKVYAISKQVGYKNVDYFHVKFRKYVSMSPVEFRRANKASSNSPDGENLEKGSLFHE